MKKIVKNILLLVIVLLMASCAKVDNISKDAIKFKTEYESLNSTKNKKGTEFRKVVIPDKNPYIYSSAEEVVQKIANGESFYVYFGDKLCPWCRSVIEKSIEIANQYKIDKIYYVPIWDDDYNEILRDKYVIEDGKAVLKSNGTEEYHQLLDYFKNLLKDYTLTSEDGSEIAVGEKRIYAPNYIYIQDGKAIKLVQGISSNQADANMQLTDEILKDEEKIFKDFFNN